MKIEQGYIFYPENPELIIPSVRLTISDSKIEIEYFQEESEYLSLNKVKTILGVFNGIGKVTFLDCYFSGNSSGSGACVEKYTVDLMLQGVHIFDWDNLKFSICKVHIPSLYDWVKIYSIDNRLWKEKKLNLKIPEDIVIAKFEKYKLLISFGYYSRVSKNKINLEENTFFKIVALKEDIHLNEYLEIIKHFKKFLILIANKSPISDSITLFSDNYKNDFDDNAIPINLIVPMETNLNTQLSISAGRIDFKDLKPNFEQILKIWYENTNLYSSIDLIIEKFLNPKLSRDNDFLNSCFSIETFHRRFKKLEVFNKSEFKKIRESIINKIENIEHKKFFEEKLSFANEPSFRARLFDLKKFFENILPSNWDIEEYIGKIVKTRNFLVHRTNSNNSFDNFEKFYAARYIECVVRVCILTELKVSQNKIDEIEKHNKRYLYQMYNLNKNLRRTISENNI